jgi:hypothetical protein
MRICVAIGTQIDDVVLGGVPPAGRVTPPQDSTVETGIPQQADRRLAVRQKTRSRSAARTQACLHRAWFQKIAYVPIRPCR